MDITGYILWALFAGMITGAIIAFIFVGIEDRKEIKRHEKRIKDRSYYDFVCWVNRKSKPIDFRIGE